MMLVIMLQMVNQFKYKTKIVDKTPERPPLPGSEGDVNRPHTRSTMSLFHSNILFNV